MSVRLESIGFWRVHIEERRGVVKYFDGGAYARCTIPFFDNRNRIDRILAGRVVVNNKRTNVLFDNKAEKSSIYRYLNFSLLSAVRNKVVILSNSTDPFAFAVY